MNSAQEKRKSWRLWQSLDRQPFEGDPSTWPVSSASAVTIGLDFGFAQDHSAIAVVMEFGWQGRAIHAVPEVIRFSLQTPASDVVDKTCRVVQKWTRPRGRPQVVVDARSNIPFFEQLIRSGITPVPVGVSATAAEVHAAEPRVIRVPVDGRQRPGLIYHLSRNQLVDDRNAKIEARALQITRVGDAGFLRVEMSALEREVTKARNIRYTTPAGAHDDCLMALCYALWGIAVLPRHRPRPRAVRGKPRFTASAWT